MFCLLGIAVALFAQGKEAQSRPNKPVDRTARQDAPGTQRPDVVQMIGPVAMNQDLRNLPYVRAKAERRRRETFDAISVPAGGFRRAGRIGDLRVRQETPQKCLAPDAHDAAAVADI